MEEIKVNILNMSPKKKIITLFWTSTHEINTNKRLRPFLLCFPSSCFVSVGKESMFPLSNNSNFNGTNSEELEKKEMTKNDDENNKM